jgi:hypothetical protein
MPETATSTVIVALLEGTRPNWPHVAGDPVLRLPAGLLLTGLLTHAPLPAARLEQPAGRPDSSSTASATTVG